MYIKKTTLEKINTLPRVYNGIFNFRNAPIEIINENDYFKLNIPELEENEVLIPINASDFDDETNEFTQRKRAKTTEEIQAEIEELKLSRYIEIDKQVKVLSYGAIGIILGIKGLTDEEMQARMNLYKILYNACKEENPNESTTSLIEAKRSLFNLANNQNVDLLTYKSLVIQKWEEGQTAFDSFNLMIEAVRTKWKLVALDNTKYNQIKSIIETIDGDTSPEDVPFIFNQIMNI